MVGDKTGQRRKTFSPPAINLSRLAIKRVCTAGFPEAGVKWTASISKQRNEISLYFDAFGGEGKHNQEMLALSGLADNSDTNSHI